MYLRRLLLKLCVFHLLIIIPVFASSETIEPRINSPYTQNVTNSLLSGSFLTPNLEDVSYELVGVLRPQYEGIEKHNQSTIQCYSQNIVARLNKNNVDLIFSSLEYKYNVVGKVNNGEISFQTPIGDTGIESVVRAKVFNNKFVFGESWFVVNRMSNLWPSLSDIKLCYGTFELVPNDGNKSNQILDIDESVEKSCKYFSSVAAGFQDALIEGISRQDLYQNIPLRVVQSTSDEFIFMMGSFINKETKNVKESVYENCIEYSKVKDNS
jgi:hypothetical protein